MPGTPVVVGPAIVGAAAAPKPDAHNHTSRETRERKVLAGEAVFMTPPHPAKLMAVIDAASV
jgi:hypothetical protein